ncbi:MAG: hypothetical protein KAS04_00405 [Candidatus Aenigmarchaeota archaeon]|nr:hypothetical protein [Candidatus Aenigmarchaeota archaeon]
MSYITNSEIIDSVLFVSDKGLDLVFRQFVSDPQSIVEAFKTYKKLSLYVDKLVSKKSKLLDGESMYVIADRTDNAIIPELQKLEKAAESVKNGKSDYLVEEIATSALMLEGTLKKIRDKVDALE